MSNIFTILTFFTELSTSNLGSFRATVVPLKPDTLALLLPNIILSMGLMLIVLLQACFLGSFKVE